jgi:ribosome biogenesis GTPase
MKSGVLMIDNPRLQKVGIETASDGIAETFPDIFERATGYRFPDCWHVLEPGCDVQEAVKCWTLFSFLLENYHLLARDLHSIRKRPG